MRDRLERRNISASRAAPMTDLHNGLADHGLLPSAMGDSAAGSPGFFAAPVCADFV
jgi:hypothetical protein